MWSDYLPSDFLDEFEAETGIVVNHTKIGSNEEILEKMKSGSGAGVDLCAPTNNRAPQWIELGLLQPFDLSRIGNIANVNPAMLRIGHDDWSFESKGPHWLPHIWGTEGIGWRTDLWSPLDGSPSYGNIWDPEVRGKTMIRPHSGMLGAGLFLETNGTLEPGDVRRAYESEDAMRPVWDRITEFCIENKSQIKLFWNDAESQKNGFIDQEVALGQTWDGPPLALKTAGEPVTYQAPREGALAWIDGMAVSAAAENLEGVYAFLEFCFDAAAAGAAIRHHGYNSAVLGADQYAGDAYKTNFQDAYPGNALANLWPWPTEPQWYADLRTEYRNKFVAA